VKPFLLSFGLSLALAAILWVAARTTTGARRAETRATPHPPRVTERNPGPDQRLGSLLASRDPDRPGAPLSARQWQTLEALDAATLARHLGATESDRTDALWWAAVQRWAMLDGPAAMAFALELRAAHPRTGNCACHGEPGGQFDSLPGEVFACWLRRDPAAALAHGSPEDPAPSSRTSLPAPPDTLVQTDLHRALDLLAGQPRIRPNAIAAAVHGMIGNPGRRSPDALGAQFADPSRRPAIDRWLAAQADESTALAVFSRIQANAPHADGWLHPDALPAHLPARDSLPLSLDEPRTAWVMGAFAIGGNPLDFLPIDDPIATRFVSGDLVAAWAYRDPSSALQWLDRQSGATLDRAIPAVMRGIAGTRPDQAVALGGHIADPSLRLAALATPFRRWHARAPDEAERWLAGSPLPPLHRSYLRGGVR